MRPLIVWGAGGHAEVTADIVRLRAEYEIVAFFDDVTPGERPPEWQGAPLHRDADQLERLRAGGVAHLLVAIGDNRVRLRCAARAASLGFTFPAQAHPVAVVAAGVSIGPGTVIMPGVVLCPGVTLGAHVVVNTGATVDHHSAIADGVHISPGACVGSRVRLGAAAFIGMGATVLGSVTVHEEAYVGAGSLVLRDVAPRMLAYGVPARERGLRPEHD